MSASFDVPRPGPLAFPITPFHDDGSLDAVAFEARLRWMLEFELPALFVACGTGEFAYLGVDDVGALVGVAVRVAGRGTPVFAGVGRALLMARALARAAEDAGAAGLLVLPPYLLTGEQDGPFAYYQAVAAATNLGVILYRRDNAIFEPETVVRLAALPNVVGFKDGLGDEERVQRIVSTVGAALTYFNAMPTAETFQRGYAATGVSFYSHLPCSTSCPRCTGRSSTVCETQTTTESIAYCASSSCRSRSYEGACEAMPSRS